MIILSNPVFLRRAQLDEESQKEILHVVQDDANRDASDDS